MSAHGTGTILDLILFPIEPGTGLHAIPETLPEVRLTLSWRSGFLLETPSGAFESAGWTL